jgi:hypothetical protein
MIHEPNGENPPEWKLITEKNRIYWGFALGYICATISWFIVWLIVK